MKTNKKLLVIITIIMFFFVSCKKSNENPEPNGGNGANDINLNIDENPNNGDILDTLSVSFEGGTFVVYSLTEQSIEGALTLNEQTGVLTIANSEAFDYETNPTITATYLADNGAEQVRGTITITLNDLEEVGTGREFVTTWQIPNGNKTVEIVINLNFEFDWNYTVDWGDGNIDTITEDNLRTLNHTYATGGTYQIKILGAFYGFKINGESRLKSVDQWGSNVWGAMNGFFLGCPDLTINASDAPNLSQVTDMKAIFRNVSNLEGDLSNWDVSNVINMSDMFHAASFNGDISNWDVSNVENMSSMFRNNPIFDQDISGWDVSSARFMGSMFLGCPFNQDISGWDVGKVEVCSNFSTNLNTANRPNFSCPN